MAEEITERGVQDASQGALGGQQRVADRNKKSYITDEQLRAALRVQGFEVSKGGTQLDRAGRSQGPA